MDTSDLNALLAAVAEGSLSIHDAADRLTALPFQDLGVALIDHHRSLRQGFPEAVYGPGKRPEEVGLIVTDLLAVGSGPVIVTRASEDQIDAAEKAGLAQGNHAFVTPGREGATVVFRPAPNRGHPIVVITAGTADGPVADECAAVLTAVGLAPTVLRDRGVAGLHRLTSALDELANADVTVVIAGMEGALASVVGGLTRGPVIAVPTSVGYGSGFDGVTALLAMMASCAAGVSVVGIDNGFGAAMAVVRALDLKKRDDNGA